MAKAKKTAGKSARAKEAAAEIGVIGGSGTDADIASCPAS